MRGKYYKRVQGFLSRRHLKGRDRLEDLGLGRTHIKVLRKRSELGGSKRDLLGSGEGLVVGCCGLRTEQSSCVFMRRFLTNCGTVSFS